MNGDGKIGPMEAIYGLQVVAGFRPSGASDIAIFPDKNLEAVIRLAISKLTGDIFASDLQIIACPEGSVCCERRNP